MTLIAAYRTPEGVAICADSQETGFYPDGEGGLHELRKALQKIAPITTGDYQLIIAGSGNAALIEVFILRLERRFGNDASSFNH
jgi:hypothetical protein